MWSIVNARNPSQLALGPPSAQLWSTRYRDLAPRLGVVYTIQRSSGHETVIRGGAGVLYDLVSRTLSNQLASGLNYARVLSSQENSFQRLYTVVRHSVSR
jgi:hypothetical protein